MNLKISMIFPGQGLQKNQKLLHLNKINNIIKKTFEEASEYLNYNIWNLIKKPFNILIKHEYIQPIILTSSISIYRFWKDLGGIDPHLSTGHSLGEYSALICSHSITFSDGLKLIHKREKMMKQCTKKFNMQMKVVIGIKKNIILKIFKKNLLTNKVNISSINSKKQIIISGYKTSIKKVSLECKKIGAKIINVPTNIVSHCFIMKKIKRKFSKQIKKISIKKTKYPVINSISIKKQISKYTIQKSLIKQLFQTVQWKKTMDFIIPKSDLILEMGTNNFLTKLHKNNKNIKFIPMNNLKNINITLNLLKK